MADPRVANVDHFTTTTHSKPSAVLDTTKVRLPSPFIVCIIGASRGIGEGVALSYAKAGASAIILAARSIDQLQDVAYRIREINPLIHTMICRCDITSSSSVKALSQSVEEAFGRLDVLVVNSGYSGNVESKVIDGSPDDGQWQQAFNVNAMGTYHAGHYFIPLLLSSINGAKAFLAYCISKMAQARIIEHIAEQFGDDGLLSVAVHPGAVETEMAESAPEEFGKYLINDVELCGAFCVWLTKEPGKMSWLNGRLISANWNPEELLQKEQEIEEDDLLKFEVKIR
ncbi:NAD(P)-binding protein [Tothia fuscella]|uniref:NAD(P)-binding protein n=1 Tax=Tothia fuscella TaxID=1048955 RepID=A0A9P4NZM5_9PEZI|nr:NAD(P)-binding protein [Tothia fuscella]